MNSSYETTYQGAESASQKRRDDVGARAMEETAAKRLAPASEKMSADANGREEENLIVDCEALISAVRHFFSLQSPYHLAEAAGADAASLEAARGEQLRLFEPVESLLVKIAATPAATGRGAGAKRRVIVVFEEYKCDGASDLAEGLRQSSLKDMQRLLRALEPAPAPARGWFRRRLGSVAYGETSSNADT